jgi:hypothetical protein
LLACRCHYRGYFDVTNAYRHEDDIQQQVNDAHAAAKWFAGLMVLIFPLGVPIMYYLLLWKERDQLDPGEAEMVGFKVVRLKVRRKEQDEKGGGGGEEGGAKNKSKWVYKYLMPERYVEKRFGIDVNAEVAGGRRKSLVGALRLAATEEERKWEAGGGWKKDFNEFYKGHETAEEFDVWGMETSETFRWRINWYMGWKKRYPLRPFSLKELNAFTLSDEEKGEGGERKTLVCKFPTRAHWPHFRAQLANSFYARFAWFLVDEDEAMNYALFVREEMSKEDSVRGRNLARLRFLWDAYKPSCWWFEVFETWRRLMLTCVLGMFAPGTPGQVRAASARAQRSGCWFVSG